MFYTCRNIPFALHAENSFKKGVFLAHKLCGSLTDVKYACFTHVIILILIYMQKVHTCGMCFMCVNVYMYLGCIPSTCKPVMLHMPMQRT